MAGKAEKYYSMGKICVLNGTFYALNQIVYAI